MQPGLISFYRSFLTPRHRYGSRNDLTRARVTLLFSVGEIVSLLLILLYLVLSSARDVSYTSGIVITAAGVLVQIGVYVLVHSGRLRPAIFITFAQLLISGAGAFATSGGVGANLVLALVPALLYGGIIWALPGLLITGAIEIGVIIFIAIQENNRSLPSALPLAPEQI